MGTAAGMTSPPIAASAHSAMSTAERGARAPDGGDVDAVAELAAALASAEQKLTTVTGARNELVAAYRQIMKMAG